jgi:prepilin-type N-terminal cleavage/methylation domain-containing protein
MESRGTRPAAGFTLIEAVMVMALVGLIAAFAVPRLDFSRFRVNGAVRGVAGVLAVAQRSAVTLQNNVNVVFNTDAHQITIHEDADNDNIIDNGERTRSYPVGEGIEFGRGGAPARLYGADRVSFTRRLNGMPVLVFRRDGSASESGGIYLTTTRATRTATPADARSVEVVRATGRAEWYRYDGSAWRRAL